MDVIIADSAQLDLHTRSALRALWNRAFGARFQDTDEEHAYGGVHVMLRDGAELIAHASAVPRRIRFAHEPWRTVGFVEAVSVDPERQGEGHGRRVMTVLADQIAARWPLALLSTGRATGFYESLGSERWMGRPYTHTAGGVVADDDHGAIMVLRIDPSTAPDLSVSVTCEDRPGRAW